ncbi:mediator complex, subunit Med7, partial [Bisporella sp. PMI_857]
STFPPPPFFWQSFTPENIARTEELRDAQTEAIAIREGDLHAQKPLDLPESLQFLQPPEPPADGNYRCFGFHYSLEDKLLPLEETGIPVLYKEVDTPSEGQNTDQAMRHTDRAFQLKKLAKSLLANWAEALDIGSSNANQLAAKLGDIETIQFNMHHLINDYRPHQARESLIQMMRDQLERSRAETEGIYKTIARTDQVLEALKNI